MVNALELTDANPGDETISVSFVSACGTTRFVNTACPAEVVATVVVPLSVPVASRTLDANADHRIAVLVENADRPPGSEHCRRSCRRAG